MRAFEEFLSTELFEGKPVALIPKLKSDVLSVKIGCEMERPIYNQGDGIQQIIITMFPVFMNREKDLLLFVEEPELYLHPGLQRRLLETLASDKFPKLQCFLSTHSNHLLDMTLDMESISVYRFSKQVDETAGREVEAKFEITSTSAGDRGVLECLGVTNSSVFLTNCTIWVEGITDRKYLRRYLEIYQDNQDKGGTRFREDTHYSFVEYSGNNITHWSFLDDNGESPDVDRLCGRLFLVTDKDSEKKLERQEKLKERLGERYYCLECREIENLLKPDIVRKVVAEYEAGEENIQPSPSYVKYENTPLGRFIEKHMLVDASVSKRLRSKDGGNPYSTPGGTVKDKVGFARRALKHIKVKDDMSAEAWKLAEKIYSFIASQNP
jgi:predicted ATP-dependent endonuclease of OLD family